MNQDAPARQPLPDDVQPRPDQLAAGGTPDSATGSAPLASFTPRFHHPTPSIPDHELLRCIGGGSYGEVWLARNVLGDYRAVKVIHRDRFEHDRPYDREFEGIQKFEPISRLHESQVDILHVGRNDGAGYFYYVMELADDAAENPKSEIRNPKEAPSTNDKKPSSNETLRASEFGIPSTFGIRNSDLYIPHTLKLDLYRRGRLSADECIRIGLALTTALEHLHGHGLVHRDVKPSNIIFVGGVPKLADIGLVASMDATMSFVGTSGFLPPEGPGTPQADIYSLGKVLYEMSMGRDRQEFPKLPADLLVAASRKSAADAESPKAESRLKSAALSRDAATALLELNAVILKACHRDPRQRYKSAKETAADLALLQSGKSVRRQRSMKHRLVLGTKILVALTALGLVVIGGYFLGGARNSLASQHKRVENPEVAMLCKLGRFHYYKITDEGFTKAMECFNKALEIDPNSVDAYTSIADLCVGSAGSENLGFKEAETKLRWARDRLMAIDDGRGAEAHAVEGYIEFLYDRSPSRAEEELRLALQLDPELLVAHIWYARYLLFTGKFEEAEREFRKARQIEPARYGLHLYIGLPSYFARDYDAAIRHFENAIKMIPNPDWALWLVGRANEEKGNYSAAIEAFRKSDIAGGIEPEKVNQMYDDLNVAYDKSGSEGYWSNRLTVAQSEYDEQSGQWRSLMVAEVYAHLNQRDSAFEWLKRAFQERSEILLWLNVDPCWDNIRSDWRFVALLERLGFGVTAGRVQQLSPAELAGTKSLEAYKKYEQGRTTRQQGNAQGLKEALKLMRESVELDPSFLRAWEELFSSYMESDAADAKSQQRAIAKKLEQLNPNSAEAHAAQAWIAYEDFEVARADDEFQRAIRQDPSRPRPHRRYGEFLLACGRLQEARRELGECEALEPGFARTQFWFGDCFFVERKYPQALAQYEHSLRLAQHERHTYSRLGRLYEADHQILKAIDAFAKMRALEAEEPEKITQRYDTLRLAFVERGEPGYWTERLVQAEAESNPEKEPYGLAVFHARLGHTEQALKLLERAWQVKDPGLLDVIVDQHWDDLRDKERFKEILTKIGYRTDWPLR